MTKDLTVLDRSTGELAEYTGSTEGMALRLQEMKQQMGLLQQFVADVMVRGSDYGVIPGTDKPTLLKPGAEKLCEFYGFAIRLPRIDEERDRESGYYQVRVTVALERRSDGVIVAEGVGEASTHEGRNRWRWTPEFKLPHGFDTTGLKVEERRAKTGRNFRMVRLENDDPWSQHNTVLKMAKKRALVDAVLSATRSSALFTQDLEDSHEEEHHEPEPAETQRGATTPWEPELREQMADKGVPGAAICEVLGLSKGEKWSVVSAAIDSWLAAEGGRTIAKLISQAADRKAAELVGFQS
jgi:hypothetical protein